MKALNSIKLFSIILILLFFSCKKEEKSALLYIDSQQLYFDDSETEKYFEISNMGNDNLNYQISSMYNILNISPNSGYLKSKQSAKILVVTELSNLEEGITRDELKISSNGGNKNIAVEIQKFPPSLYIDSKILDFKYYQTLDTIIVQNTTKDTLYYHSSTTSNWMCFETDIRQITPFKKDTIIISINRYGLNNDNYNGIINITNDTEEIEVNVSMKVGGPPYLSVNTDLITLAQTQTKDTIRIKNIGNDTLSYQIIPTSNWLSFSKSSGKITQGADEIEVIVDKTGMSGGFHSGLAHITSNGGNKDIIVNFEVSEPSILYWDIDYFKIINNSDREYITVQNDGAENLDYQLNSSSIWLNFSQSSGNLSPGQEDKVWVIADRNGLNNDLYSGVVNITSNGGNADIDVDMEVGVYSVSFFNPTYTVIDITVPGFGTQQIPVLDRKNYIYPSNPGAIIYQAETKGETVNSQQLGLTQTWNETINLNGEDSPVFALNIGEDFFFLSAKNFGSHDLNNWSINYNTDYQFDENVNIPTDGNEYYFGYYDALNKSTIYAAIVGTNYDAVWQNGNEFNFPWTVNQRILVESDLKSNIVKNSRTFIKDSSESEILNLKPQTQKAIRIRNVQSLVNTNRK